MSQNILPGTVQAAPSGLQGFDADTVITAEVAKQFYNDNYRFCVRYLSRGEEQQGDLSTQEALDILNSGLALMAVQHVRRPGWIPTGELGSSDGTAAAINATVVGFPKGVNIWCDLEGIADGTPAADVIRYCNSWHDAVASAGYIPGLYVGAGCILNGAQLYFDLKFKHYWKSESSSSPNVEKRGFQLIQHFHGTLVNGIGIDIDNTQNDNLGGQVQWLIKL